jgi:NitT/TauT family transport system ATP-binding protein
VTTDAPFIDVRTIQHRFGGSSADGGIDVIADATFAIERGEFCCLIGPSGCGKSTLLRVIDGLLRPAAGEVRIDGRLVTGPGRDRGMVFQDFGLFPWRTALANVAFGLEVQGVQKRERIDRARELLATVGLTGFEHFYPRQLSGGMRQRVGVARALAVDPSILLMDEPFGALDAQTKLVLQGDLARLVDKLGTTCLFVTHDIEEAVFLADRVVVMDRRPSTIVESLTVDLARPREDAVRATPRFGELKAHLWETLRRIQPAALPRGAA